MQNVMIFLGLPVIIKGRISFLVFGICCFLRYRLFFLKVIVRLLRSFCGLRLLVLNCFM